MKKVIITIFLITSSVVYSTTIGLDSGHSIKESYKSGPSFSIATADIDPNTGLNITNQYYTVAWPAGGVRVGTDAAHPDTLSHQEEVIGTYVRMSNSVDFSDWQRVTNTYGGFNFGWTASGTNSASPPGPLSIRVGDPHGEGENNNRFLDVAFTWHLTSSKPALGDYSSKSGSWFAGSTENLCSKRSTMVDKIQLPGFGPFPFPRVATEAAIHGRWSRLCDCLSPKGEFRKVERNQPMKCEPRERRVPGVLSFGTFLCTSKEKYRSSGPPARGSWRQLSSPREAKV